VLVSLLLILWFMASTVFPKFDVIFRDFHTDLPGITKLVFALGNAIPWVVLIVALIFVAWPLTWIALRASRMDRAAADLALPIPLIGPVLKRNLIARWCDAMRLGVVAGMDLPTAIHLSGDIVGSPALRRDGERIIQQISQGKDLTHLEFRPRVVPSTALAMLQMSAERNDLSTSLQSLSELYERRAEARLGSVYGILTPLLVILMAMAIGLVILALFAPMVSLIQTVSSPGK
jgi:type IV pilus assembly protein PilC